MAEAQALAHNSKVGGDDSVETETSDTQDVAHHWLTDYAHSDRRPSAAALTTALDVNALEKVVVGTESAPGPGTPANALAPPAAALDNDDDENVAGAADSSLSPSELEKQQREQEARGVQSDKFLASPFIFQQFIGYTKGRDLRVMVVKGKVIGAMMRSSKPGGFKANVHAGGSVSKVECGPALSEIAIETAKLCQLDIAGVDLMMSQKSYVVCEVRVVSCRVVCLSSFSIALMRLWFFIFLQLQVNSSPGFEGLEHATESNIAAKMLDEIISVCEQASVAEPTKSRKTRHFPLQPEHH